MKLKSKYEKELYVEGLVVLLYCSTGAVAQTGELVINVKGKGADVSSSMYGIFFEEINHAGDGGLYGELIKNRSFEELEMSHGYTAKGDRLIPVQSMLARSFGYSPVILSQQIVKFCKLCPPTRANKYVFFRVTGTDKFL